MGICSVSLFSSVLEDAKRPGTPKTFTYEQVATILNLVGGLSAETWFCRQFLVRWVDESWWWWLEEVSDSPTGRFCSKPWKSFSVSWAQEKSPSPLLWKMNCSVFFFSCLACNCPRQPSTKVRWCWLPFQDGLFSFYCWSRQGRSLLNQAHLQEGCLAVPVAATAHPVRPLQARMIPRPLPHISPHVIHTKYVCWGCSYIPCSSPVISVIPSDWLSSTTVIPICSSSISLVTWCPMQTSSRNRSTGAVVSFVSCF